MVYMKCLKNNENTSTACRALSRDYLECRMQKWVLHCRKSGLLIRIHRGLMERDEWKNLGLNNVAEADGS